MRKQNDSMKELLFRTGVAFVGFFLLFVAWKTNLIPILFKRWFDSSLKEMKAEAERLQKPRTVVLLTGERIQVKSVNDAGGKWITLALDGKTYKSYPKSEVAEIIRE